MWKFNKLVGSSIFPYIVESKNTCILNKIKSESDFIDELIYCEIQTKSIEWNQWMYNNNERIIKK